MKKESDPDLKWIIVISVITVIVVLNSVLFAGSPIDVIVHVHEDNSSEAIPFCTVTLLDKDRIVTEASTDFDGIAHLTVNAGKYKIKVTSIGFSPDTIDADVSISNKKFSVGLKKGVQLNEVIVEEYSRIKAGSPAHISTFSSEEIKAAPTRDVNSVTVITGGLVDGSYTRGSRDDGATYLVDGAKVRGSYGYKSEVVSEHRKMKMSGKARMKDEVESEKSTAPAIPQLENFQNLLTAGEINDFSKWKLWENESAETLKSISEDFGIEAGKRFCFSVIDQNSIPVIDARVHLIRKDMTVTTSHTDNMGIAECWNNKDDKDKLSAQVYFDGKVKFIEDIKPFENGINKVQIERTCSRPDTFDLAFIVDATGSMDDEIQYLKAEMLGLVNSINKKNDKLVIRIASVFYRDLYDRYTVEYSDFTTDATAALNYISEHGADGGGDLPEAMDSALFVAGKLNWSSMARSRIAMLITDAPPHHEDINKSVLAQSMSTMTEKGIRIVPIVCSGTDKTTEYLLRNMALLTNGTYIYLTDHSGVGDGHMDPTTKKLDHKMLNKLLLSVIKRFTNAPECVNETANNDQVESPVNKEIEEDVANIISEGKEISGKATVSPNPTSGKIHIKSGKTISEVQLFDINAKVYKKVQLDSKSADLDFGDLAIGKYILKVFYGTEFSTVRIIIQK